MTENTYQGWHRDGTRCVIYFGEGQVYDLVAVCSADGFTGCGPVEWGQRGQGAELLGRLLLWHATWDRAVVEDLSDMFHDQHTSRFPPTWQIDRETVRTWVQQHQFYRDLMHGRDPLRNCPGCG